MSFWCNKEILILGGTGSLGKTITKILKTEYNVMGIRIYSRDEYKQWEFQKELNKNNLNKNIAFFIGDVRDKERLNRAMHNVDIVVNCAAMKQVPACEYNPHEPVKTNINGAMNVIDCAVDNQVDRVMHISTDKAVYPINIYGATKAVAEKLFIHGNIYGGASGPKFSICRYGNVLGSRGSVVPLFKEQAESGKLGITDLKMTRFWITLDKVARFIINNLETMEGREIFVPKMPSMKIVDVARTIVPNCEIEEVGIRQGEKLHECLITFEESCQMLEYNNMYVINDSKYENKNNWAYYSDTNDQWLTQNEFKEMMYE